MNYTDYRFVIQEAQFGYAYHEIIIDESGVPYDYRFLEVNQEFENLTGLKASDITGKTVREVLPGIENSEFNWIQFYGNIALMGGSDSFEQFNEQLGRWYNVKVYSPDENFFTTIFVDVTHQHNLADVFAKLNRFTQKNVDYQYITDQMMVFSGAQFVALNKYEENGADFSTVAASGLNKVPADTVKLLDFQLVGKRWKFDAVREEKIRSRKTTFFGHLNELVGNLIHGDLINTLVGMTDSGMVAVVKTMEDDQLVGDFTLIFKTGHQMTNQWLVESYADIVGILLSRIIAEEAMLRQKTEFEDFFNVTLDLLCIADNEGHFLKLNKIWESVLGYPLEELEQKKFLDFVHPEDIQITLEALARHAAQDSVLEFVNRYRCFDGSYRFIEWRSIPRGNLIYAAARDITERLNVEQELIKKNRFIQTVLDNLPIGVALNELEKGMAFYVNKKFEEIYGWPSDEMTDISAFFQKVYPDELYRKEIMDRVMRDIQSGDPERMHWENIIITTKDGTKKIVNSANIPLFDQNIMVSTVSDVTEQKQAESELMASKVRAEESDRLKSAFLANMSHEIRTPMNGILGFTELLKEPKLSGEEQQMYISIIEKSGGRLLNIINDIISLSKIESGQTEVILTETNIYEQISYLHAFFKPEADSKDIELKINASEKVKGIRLRTDKEKIYAILTNLIKNAIKFTHSGSIEIGCQYKFQSLEFSVTDTGMGIPPEQKSVIFERFRQGTTSLTRNYEGAGLGLSISKGYVEMLGGTIWVESEPGKGSAFHFTIPCISPQGKVLDNEIPASVQDDQKQIPNLKILIAEDDHPSELYLKIALHGLSREVLNARNGIEAVEVCRKNPDIDIVFMDLQMPGLNGYEATRQIREFNPSVIIIAQTAFALNDDKGKAIESGCNDYLAKPVSKTMLMQVLEKYRQVN
jgi:PAS domain S-box-containing protein